MRFVLFKDRKKEWRWRLLASNGRTIADSAEGYRRPSGAYAGALRVKLGAGKARIDR